MPRTGIYLFLSFGLNVVAWWPRSPYWSSSPWWTSSPYWSSCLFAGNPYTFSVTRVRPEDGGKSFVFGFEIILVAITSQLSNVIFFQVSTAAWQETSWGRPCRRLSSRSTWPTCPPPPTTSSSSSSPSSP